MLMNIPSSSTASWRDSITFLIQHPPKVGLGMSSIPTVLPSCHLLTIFAAAWIFYHRITYLIEASKTSFFWLQLSRVDRNFSTLHEPEKAEALGLPHTFLVHCTQSQIGLPTARYPPCRVL